MPPTLAVAAANLRAELGRLAVYSGQPIEEGHEAVAFESIRDFINMIIEYNGQSSYIGIAAFQTLQTITPAWLVFVNARDSDFTNMNTNIDSTDQ